MEEAQGLGGGGAPGIGPENGLNNDNGRPVLAVRQGNPRPQPADEADFEPVGRAGVLYRGFSGENAHGEAFCLRNALILRLM